MKKPNFLWAILNSIFLVVFNVLFFVLGGTEHNTSVRMSYAFIHFAYFMLLLTPKLVDKRKNLAVFGYSLYSISSIYFLTQFFIGILFILVAPEGYKAALSVQLCIAGLYGIILVSYMIANEHTASAEEKRQVEIAYVKNASIKLKSLLERINDKETKKSVERVHNTIYSSPAKSHPDLAEMETQILESINELESTVATSDKEKIISTASALLVLVNERNNLLKTLQ